MLGTEPPEATDARPEDAPAGRRPRTSSRRPRTILANLQSMLTKALNKTGDDDDWSRLSSLGSHLNRTDPSFDSRTYGFAKLSDLVQDQPYLETRTTTTSAGGDQLWARLKGHRPARQEPAKKAGARKATARKSTRKATQESDGGV